MRMVCGCASGVVSCVVEVVRAKSDIVVKSCIKLFTWLYFRFTPPQEDFSWNLEVIPIDEIFLCVIGRINFA